MAGVSKRTSNSVQVQIKSYTEWQQITVGGSVIFEWKVENSGFSNHVNYFIRISKKNPYDKMNYIVTYTHWQVMDEISTNEMSVRADHFKAMYCPNKQVHVNRLSTVTVTINLEQLSPHVVIYDDTELTDFMLRGEDGSVPFHKVVLAAHSSVFKTMLAGDWKETSEGVINIPGTSKEMLQHLKMYMYLGKLPDEKNDQADCIKQLLLLSSCYLIEDLKLRCIKKLRFLLTIKNVSDMIQFAMENNIKGFLVEIMDCTAMGDIDLSDVRKLVEAEGATLMKCK